MFRINPQSPDPIFQQLASQVKESVARGQLKEGDKLPSVRELAREATVNPNTVVKAYDILESEGVIYRRQGAGCFVTGKTTNLGLPERRKRLAKLMEKAVSDGTYLGFDGPALLAALEEQINKNRKSS